MRNGITKDLNTIDEISSGEDLSFKSIIDKVPFAFTIVSFDGTVLFINKKGLEMYEGKLEEVIGKKVAENIWVDPSRRQDWMEEIKANGLVNDFEFQAKSRSGKRFWVVASGQLVTYQGQVCVLTTQHDITDRKLAEEALMLNEAKYRLLTEYASDVIWVFNLGQGCFSYISPSIKQLRGFSVEEAMAEKLDEALDAASYNKVMSIIAANIEAFLSNPETEQNYLVEIRQPCKDGSYVWVEVSGKFRFSASGEVEIVGVSRNIEDRKKSQEEVLYLSRHDQLTGLYNRRYYEEELAWLDNPNNYPLALVLADVNGLKLTNDAFGHQAGDELLKRIAGILKEACRSKDVLARIGGDEFTFLLPNTDQQQTELLINGLRERISEVCDSRLVMSVSFGYAVKNENGQRISDLFAKAEDMMYREKLSESAGMKVRTLKLITNGLYEKDVFEREHSEAVSELCRKLALALGFEAKASNDIALAGLLHDIGKIGIDDAVLLKDTSLDDAETVQIRQHPEIGYHILLAVPEFASMAESVLSHHERYDGKGYPRGLAGEEIPLQGRIIAVAEAFHAMTCSKLYRDGLSLTEALNELRNNAGSQFDPKVVEVFIKYVLV